MQISESQVGEAFRATLVDMPTGGTERERQAYVNGARDALTMLWASMAGTQEAYESVDRMLWAILREGRDDANAQTEA